MTRVILPDDVFVAALATSLSDHATPHDLPAYAGALCGSLLTTRSTPPALRVASSGFDRIGAGDVAALCRRKAEEETGHDALVLADLAAIGIDEGVAAQVASTWACQLAWTHHDFATRKRPFGVLGWMFALERFAALVTVEALAAIQALVPPDLDITRMRRVHSGIGDDAGHVAELGAVIARLAPADARIVEHAVGIVVPMIVGAALDPAPSQRLAEAGWRSPGACETTVSGSARD